MIGGKKDINEAFKFYFKIWKDNEDISSLEALVDILEKQPQKIEMSHQDKIHLLKTLKHRLKKKKILWKRKNDKFKYTCTFLYFKNRSLYN